MAELFSLVGTVLTAALQGAVEGAAGKLTEGPAARDWFLPDRRYDVFGFRVVVVPSSRRRSDS